MLKRSVILALLIGWLAAPSLWARIWTDRQGRQTDAQFVRLKGESVVLQKGLKPLVIPFKEFCDEDQEYIKGLTKGKGSTNSASDVKAKDEPKDEPKDAPKDATLPSAFKPKNQKSAASEKNAADVKTAASEKNAVDDNPFLTDEENVAKPKSPTKSKSAAESKSETPATKSKQDIESNPFLAVDEKSTPDKSQDKENAGNTPPPTPRPAPNHSRPASSSPFSAMNQQAEAHRQHLQELQNRMAADAEKRRQKVEEAWRQRDAQQQAEQQQRMAENQQNNDFMSTPAMPSFPANRSISANADSEKSFFDKPENIMKVVIGGGFLLIIVLVLVVLILRMIFGQLPPDAKTRGLNSTELGICLVFPGFGLIAGLLWMAQRFRKGKAATLYSAGMILLRLIAAAIYISSKN